MYYVCIYCDKQCVIALVDPKYFLILLKYCIICFFEFIVNMRAKHELGSLKRIDEFLSYLTVACKLHTHKNDATKHIHKFTNN